MHTVWKISFIAAISTLPLAFAMPNLSQLEALSSAMCPASQVVLHDKNIVLNAEKQTEKQDESRIYFFKNTSDKSIWLDHPVKNASASAGWSSYLRPGNWSALLLDKKSFELSCAMIEPGKVDYLVCAKALSICNPAHATFHTNRKGSYWLVEDKSWKDLLKGLLKRGVKL
jgi:hypothetical protein